MTINREAITKFFIDTHNHTQLHDPHKKAFEVIWDYIGDRFDEFEMINETDTHYIFSAWDSFGDERRNEAILRINKVTLEDDDAEPDYQ